MLGGAGAVSDSHPALLVAAARLIRRPHRAVTDRQRLPTDILLPLGAIVCRGATGPRLRDQRRRRQAQLLLDRGAVVSDSWRGAVRGRSSEAGGSQRLGTPSRTGARVHGPYLLIRPNWPCSAGWCCWRWWPHLRRGGYHAPGSSSHRPACCARELPDLPDGLLPPCSLQPGGSRQGRQQLQAQGLRLRLGNLFSAVPAGAAADPADRRRRGAHASTAS